MMPEDRQELNMRRSRGILISRRGSPLHGHRVVFDPHTVAQFSDTGRSTNYRRTDGRCM